MHRFGRPSVFLTLVAGTVAVMTQLRYTSDFYAQRQAAAFTPEAVMSNP